MKVDISWLEKQHDIYKKCTRPKDWSKPGMEWKLDGSVFKTPDKAYLDIRKTLGETLSEEAIDKIIEDTIISTRAETASYIRELLYSGGVSPYMLQELTGISDDTIKKAISETRSLPKDTLFGLCLVFMMDSDEVDEALSRTGHVLSSELPDTIFKQFIEEQNYDLMAFVDAVIETAETITKNSGKPIPLPKFYSGAYTDTTIERNRPL